MNPHMNPLDLPETDEFSTVAAPSPCIVISQPMYFPWVGMLEQIRLCDTFVFYDDVQYARGFFNRVQIPARQQTDWLSVPLHQLHRGQRINEVQIENSDNWRRNHLERLRHAYSTAPYRDEVLTMVDGVLSCEYNSLAALAIASMLALVDYFALGPGKQFYTSSAMNTPGASTQRLIDLCLRLNAKSYLTGHGARNYLEHSSFEEQGIDVHYICYGLKEYPRTDGPFTPYVTALDLVAHCGKAGGAYITGKPISWREFLKTPNNTKQEK